MPVGSVEELIRQWNEARSAKRPFGSVIRKLSKRRDLCAMLIISDSVETDDRVVSYACDGDIRFFPTLEQLANALTPQDIKDLCACGVYLEEEERYIGMIV